MYVFNNIYLYITTSFVVMLVITIKLLRPIVGKFINDKIQSIHLKIEKNESKKSSSIDMINKLKIGLIEAHENMQDSISEAKMEEKLIADRAGEELFEALQDREMEYKKTIEKVEDSLFAQLQKKMVDAMILSAKEKIAEQQDDRNIQNDNIENSIKMLSKLAAKKKQPPTS